MKQFCARSAFIAVKVDSERHSLRPYHLLLQETTRARTHSFLQFAIAPEIVHKKMVRNWFLTRFIDPFLGKKEIGSLYRISP